AFGSEDLQRSGGVGNREAPHPVAQTRVRWVGRLVEEIIKRGHVHPPKVLSATYRASFIKADSKKNPALRQASGRFTLITASRFSSAKSEIPFTTHQTGSPQVSEAARRPTPSISPPMMRSSPGGRVRTNSFR